MIDLFFTFARIGLFTFGGGYAMLSLIGNTCVDEKKWITHDEMMNITVIAESTPGPIAINCATYVGFKQKKLAGAVVATLGMIFPSFVIMYVISRFLDGFLEITWVAHAFRGIKIAVGILIVDAAVKMLKKMKKSAFGMCMVIASLIAMMIISVLKLNISSMLLMLLAAFIGITFFVIRDRIGKEKSENDLS